MPSHAVLCHQLRLVARPLPLHEKQKPVSDCQPTFGSLAHQQRQVHEFGRDDVAARLSAMVQSAAKSDESQICSDAWQLDVCRRPPASAPGGIAGGTAQKTLVLQ